MKQRVVTWLIASLMLIGTAAFVARVIREDAEHRAHGNRHLERRKYWSSLSPSMQSAIRRNQADWFFRVHPICPPPPLPRGPRNPGGEQ